jgi:hypothetical protein
MTDPTPDEASRGYTQVVTLDEFKAALQKGIDERGANYVYREPVCMYVSYGLEPQCGVGYAMVELGLRDRMVAAIGAWQDEETHNGAGLESIWQPQATALIDRLAHDGIRFERDARDFAARFQDRQDQRVPWGKAYAEAEESQGVKLTGIRS